MTELKLEHVHKVYKGKKKGQEVPAVTDFNLESNKKEFIVFVGPSGCGKSTTLRMIAGLEEITSGKLFIDGELMNKVEPRYRNVAMVFQNYALYPHMTAYNNMAFGLRNMKVSMPKLDKEGKQIKGIDKGLIHTINVEKRKTERQIKKAERAEQKVNELDVNIKALEEELAKHNEQDKEFKSLSKKLESVKYKKLLNERVAENLPVFKAQLEQVNNDIEYYSNNEVDLFVEKHFSKQEIDERIKKAAQILDIEPLLKRLPGNMSGGQRQRVALGRAIVRTPKLFLLDEPLSNLDAKLRAQMRVEITKLYDKLDTTFIYVTHDQVEALTMGTRIVVLNAGYVQQIDTPSRLYDYPKNRFVAGFLGTPQMNFYEVEIKKNKANLDVHMFDGVEFSIPLNKLRKMEKEYLDGESHSAILGIRGEDIKIDEKGHFKAKVCLNESLGSDTLVYADFDANKEIDIRDSLSSIVIKAPGRVEKERESVVRFDFDINKIHFFRNDNDKEDSILEESIGQD